MRRLAFLSSFVVVFAAAAFSTGPAKRPTGPAIETSNLVFGELELQAIRSVARARPDLLSGLSPSAADLLRSAETMILSVETSGRCTYRLQSGRPYFLEWPQFSSTDYERLADVLTDSNVVAMVRHYRRKLLGSAAPSALRESLSMLPTDDAVVAPLGAEIAALAEQERTALIEDVGIGKIARAALAAYDAARIERMELIVTWDRNSRSVTPGNYELAEAVRDAALEEMDWARKLEVASTDGRSAFVFQPRQLLVADLEGYVVLSEDFLTLPSADSLAAMFETGEATVFYGFEDDAAVYRATSVEGNAAPIEE